VEDYPGRSEEVLRGVKAPPKQRTFNTASMKIEQVKPDGTFYRDGEQRDGMWKCTEWVEEGAIPTEGCGDFEG
jgi:hypothetical protein